MNFVEIEIKIPDNNFELSEIIIAFLAEINYESFSFENSVLKAYISEEQYQENILKTLLEDYDLKFNKAVIQQKNWNAEWEKNYPPVIIDNLLTIIAPFHRIEINTQHKIIIEPKMAFGTGHHETTNMMCKLLANLAVSDKKVLDMGCGSGVLAIFAELLGAKNITAIDIDEWSYINTKDNAKINKCQNICVIQGSKDAIPNKIFDIILANINLNVLMQQIPTYANHLKSGGYMLLSGFYKNETTELINLCEINGLLFESMMENNMWASLVFKKE